MPDQPPGQPEEGERQGEHRLLPSIAVVVLIVLPFLLPEHLHATAYWVLAGLETALLIAIVAVDPGRVDRRSTDIRGLSIGLIGVLLVAAALATLLLVLSLVDGAAGFDAAGALLATGALVWLDANLTFSLLYWELDGGGPAQRLHDPRDPPDLAFVQHLNPDLAKPGWQPTFIDYLYLGLTNSLAFSPTDVMPLAHWAKLAMAAQSMVSLAILSLAIANAVNLLN
jgi:hypothetical protein